MVDTLLHGPKDHASGCCSLPRPVAPVITLVAVGAGDLAADLAVGADSEVATPPQLRPAMVDASSIAELLEGVMEHAQ